MIIRRLPIHIYSPPIYTSCLPSFRVVLQFISCLTVKSRSAAAHWPLSLIENKSSSKQFLFLEINKSRKVLLVNMENVLVLKCVYQLRTEKALYADAFNLQQNLCIVLPTNLAWSNLNCFFVDIYRVCNIWILRRQLFQENFNNFFNVLYYVLIGFRCARMTRMLVVFYLF